MFRLVNSNQERLKFFQELQDERREEIISIMMEDIDLIVFHIEEQDMIRSYWGKKQPKIIIVFYFSNILHKIFENFQKIAGFSVETFEVRYSIFILGNNLRAVYNISAFPSTISDRCQPSIR